MELVPILKTGGFHFITSYDKDYFHCCRFLVPNADIWKVDVRDVSRVHILALDSPATSNQRVQLVHGLITPQLVVNIIRKNFPELKSRVPEGNPSQVVPHGVRISR